jgi:hypothetical protein
MMRRRHALLYLAVISLLVLITWRRVADVQELDDKAAVFGGLNLTSAAASDSETDKFRSLFAASEREAEQLKQANNDLDVRLARCTSELEHLKSLPSPVSAPDEQHEDALVLFTTATGTHMNELRELAGVWPVILYIHTRIYHYLYVN